MLSLFFKNIHEFEFTSAKKVDVFQYGEDRIGCITHLLEGRSYFKFIPEKGIVYINIYILAWTALFFLKTRRLRRSYFLALVNCKTQKLFITCKDNDLNYSSIARFLRKKIRVIALQNGSRFEYKYDRDIFLNNVFHSELFCFGKHDLDLIQSIGGTVVQPYPIGPLRPAVYRQTQNKKASLLKKPSYDLCFISDNYTGWNERYPFLEETIGLVLFWCQKYCEEHNLKLIIPCKQLSTTVVGKEKISEVDFYSRFAPLNNIEISFRDENPWNTYNKVEESRLIVGISSTMLLDALSMGRRVLFCDYFGDPWSHNVTSPLAHVTRNPTYEAFEEQVDNALSDSQADYIGSRGEAIENCAGNVAIDQRLSRFSTVIESALV